jgi:O-antigen ligase
MLKSYLTTLSSKFQGIAALALFAIAITLPWSLKANSISIIVFAVATLFAFGPVAIWKSLNRLSFLYILFYLLHVIGMLYTTNTAMGGFELEKKLALILFPLFVPVHEIDIVKRRQVLLLFAISCTMLIVYFLFVASVKYWYLDTIEYFLAGSLVVPTNIHRVYLSMYLLWSVVIAFDCIIIFPQKWIRLFCIVMILVLNTAIYLLASRTALLVYFVVMSVYLYEFIFKRKNYVLGMVIFMFGALALSGIMLNKNMREIFTQTYTHINDGNSRRTFSSANLRVIKWKSALEVIQENWLLGVGTGDGTDQLHKKYVEKNFFWGKKYKFNAHNQYLEIWLTLGVVGLISWLAVVYFSIQNARLYQNRLYLNFIIIFSIFIFTECMLNAQKGVVFYAFFSSILILGKHQKMANPHEPISE